MPKAIINKKSALQAAQDLASHEACKLIPDPFARCVAKLLHLLLHSQCPVCRADVAKLKAP